MQSGRESQEWKIKMFFYPALNVRWQAVLSSQMPYLLLSYGRLFVQEVFLCLGLCIFESLSGLYVLACNS